MKVPLAIPALAAALVLSGCTSGGSESTAAPVPDKYTQTWTISYAETTCQDWLNTMSENQKFAASADILTAARNKIDGGSGVPEDAMILEFADGISNACVIPSMTLTDVTFGLYSTEPRFKP